MKTGRKKEPIEIQNLENVTGTQFGGKKLKISGSIFRLKKQERITEVTYACKQCGKKWTSPKPILETKIKCPDKECGSRNVELIDCKTTAGFFITIINDLTKITSGETTKAFASCESLGIRINPKLKEKKEIGNILNKVGKTITIEGTLKTKNKYDKNTQEYLLEKEINADNIKFVDYLKDFKLSTEKIKELKEFFGTKKWTTEEIDQIIIPEIIGRSLTKKFVLLTSLTTKTITVVKGKVKHWGVGRGAIFGDPGEAKSEICKRFIETYCEGLNALKITAETLSMAGLKGGVVQDTDSSWEIDWGILSWCHNGMLIMDGYHAFDKQSIASLRETETNNRLDIFKIVKGSRECAFRGIKISNIRLQPIKKFYDTKYMASFDTGYGPQDQENKFDDADRRRVDWIMVYSEKDVENSLVDETLIDSIIPKTSKKVNQQIKDLIKFAWTRNSEHINHKAITELKPQIMEILSKWREEYPEIKLSILGKEGSLIFIKYLIASAILHFNIDDQGIITPTIENVNFVKELYEDMFEHLEIQKTILIKEFEKNVVTEIFSKLNEKQKIMLSGLKKHKSISALESRKICTRMDFYRKFKSPLALSIPPYYISEYYPLDGYIGEVNIDPIAKEGKLSNLGFKIVDEIQKEKVEEKNQEKPIKIKEEKVENDTSSSNEAVLHPPKTVTSKIQQEKACNSQKQGLVTNVTVKEEKEDTLRKINKINEIKKTLSSLSKDENCNNCNTNAKTDVIEPLDLNFEGFENVTAMLHCNIPEILRFYSSCSEISLVSAFKKRGIKDSDMYNAVDDLKKRGIIFELKNGVLSLV